MWTYIFIACGIILALLLIMITLYILLIKRVRDSNTKIYKFKTEENIKEENILIIYQPSRHKTTEKIVELIKEEINNTEYGYVIHTLDEKKENYDKYKRVLFVAPVYFGAIHNEFLKKIMEVKFKNLTIVYNGLNKESSKEDEFVKKYLNKYNKIKLHTDDIDSVKEFIQKEIVLWKKL